VLKYVEFWEWKPWLEVSGKVVSTVNKWFFEDIKPCNMKAVEVLRRLGEKEAGYLVEVAVLPAEIEELGYPCAGYYDEKSEDIKLYLSHIDSARCLVHTFFHEIGHHIQSLALGREKFAREYEKQLIRYGGILEIRNIPFQIMADAYADAKVRKLDETNWWSTSEAKFLEEYVALTHGKAWFFFSELRKLWDILKGGYSVLYEEKYLPLEDRKKWSKIYISEGEKEAKSFIRRFKRRTAKDRNLCLKLLGKYFV